MYENKSNKYKTYTKDRQTNTTHISKLYKQSQTIYKHIHAKKNISKIYKPIQTNIQKYEPIQAICENNRNEYKTYTKHIQEIYKQIQNIYKKTYKHIRTSIKKYTNKYNTYTNNL